MGSTRLNETLAAQAQPVISRCLCVPVHQIHRTSNVEPDKSIDLCVDRYDYEDGKVSGYRCRLIPRFLGPRTQNALNRNNDIKYMKNTNSESENPTPTERMKLRVKEGQRGRHPQALLSWGLCPC